MTKKYNKLLKWKLDSTRVAQDITFIKQFKALIWLPDINKGDLNRGGFHLIPNYQCKAHAIVKAYKKSTKEFLCEYTDPNEGRWTNNFYFTNKLVTKWVHIDCLDGKGYYW